MNILKLKPTQNLSGQSIRMYLQSLFVGKKTIYHYSSNQRFMIQKRIVNSEYRLKADDVLEIILEQVSNQFKSQQKINIVYEDEDFLVVKKPANLLMHTDGKQLDSLTSRVAAYMDEKGYFHPVLPCHRLDKETRGLVVFGKHFVSLSYLSHLFEDDLVEKVYLAQVEGVMQNKKGTIQSPILYDKTLKKAIISKFGKPSKTTYEVLSIQNNQSQVLLKIESGRTHQIRVHLSSLGYPVIGDILYGSSFKEAMRLESIQITFKHFRDEKEVTFK